MNPIKDFFKKLKSDQKFKTAGPGHKLSASTTASAKSAPRLESAGSFSSQHRQLSEEAKRAGAAALARIEQETKPSVNWSSYATKAQVKKELELENSLKTDQSKKINNVAPKEIVQDACPTLAVSGVYFTCPIIGPDVLPKKEIQEKIRTFLYEQLEHERGLTACLIIHTLNKNKDKVSVGIETLLRYLANVIDNPTEEKYRKIRVKNKVFQERVANLEGAIDLLMAAGFTLQKLKVNDQEDDYYVLLEESTDLENLQMLKEALLSAEPIVPILDRNLKVLKPSQVTEKMNLPSDFFNLSAEEIKREQENKMEAVELLTQLRTKAMRERDEIRELHVYKFSLVRVRFPDGIILQGTFYVYEKLSAVKEFVAANLIVHDKEFDLLLPGGYKLTDDEQSLLELKLVPAVVINFQWSDDKEFQSYLNPDVTALLEDL